MDKPDQNDALWADYHYQPSSDWSVAPPAIAGSGEPPRSSAQAKRMPVVFAWLALIGSVVVPLVVSRFVGDRGWMATLLVAVSVVLGAAGGYGSGVCLFVPALIVWALSFSWVVGASLWHASRMPWPESAILTTLPLLLLSALLPGGALYFLADFLPGRLGKLGEAKKEPARANPAIRLHVEVIYDAPRDPQEGPLKERLLELCRQDRAMAERLLAHERDQYPQEGAVAHLRLAIARFERDRQ